jgi:low temperature requirement protein LtrA
MAESGPLSPRALAHRVTRMTGRDPNEPHRAATPLELLFDLTFVVGFGVAAEQLAHLLAEGHLASGLIGFGFAMFAVCWAWINFSWFASAYDTDDWPFRVTTMVQMVGVLIFTLGLPDLFRSIDEGHHVDNRVMVAGYVVMRVAMVFQWLRAATQDPARRSACRTYATTILVAQVGWFLLLLAETSVVGFFLLAVPLILIELAGPWIAETRKGGTPWHAHHIAERYGLLAIIALGEGVIGTVASLAAVVEHQGWTLDAALVGVAGTGLTFGMWWTYFLIPSARILAANRERAFP